jgi:hypothetical protein
MRGSLPLPPFVLLPFAFRTEKDLDQGSVDAGRSSVPCGGIGTEVRCHLIWNARKERKDKSTRGRCRQGWVSVLHKCTGHGELRLELRLHPIPVNEWSLLINFDRTMGHGEGPGAN